MSATVLTGDYPQTWAEYVGQDDAKRALRIAAKGAAIRGDLMHHTLISSPLPGQGKTALALLTASTLGRTIHLRSGRIKANEARMLFAEVEDGDVVLWDEFHKAVDGGKQHVEWLLHFLENGVMLDARGAEELPKVTFIAATTDKGVLPATIVQRFTVIELERYTEEQAMMIALQLSNKMLPAAGLATVDDDTAMAIALAASGQPRLMRNILNTLRDLAVCGEIPAAADGAYALGDALKLAGLTADGLDREARTYLTILFKELRAEPAGAALMRERMGLVGKGLSLIEQALLDKEMISKTKQGRILTGKGLRRAKELCGEVAA